MNKIKIGLLGLGTVGTGVYKLIRMRSDIMEKTIGAKLEIKKILVHNKNKKREGVDENLLTDNWKEIVEDGEIQIIVEVIGGIEPARTMILEALRAGKKRCLREQGSDCGTGKGAPRHCGRVWKRSSFRGSSCRRYSDHPSAQAVSGGK